MWKIVFKQVFMKWRDFQEVDVSILGASSICVYFGGVFNLWHFRSPLSMVFTYATYDRYMCRTSFVSYKAQHFGQRNICPMKIIDITNY